MCLMTMLLLLDILLSLQVLNPNYLHHKNHHHNLSLLLRLNYLMLVLMELYHKLYVKDLHNIICYKCHLLNMSHQNYLAKITLLQELRQRHLLFLLSIHQQVASNHRAISLNQHLSICQTLESLCHFCIDPVVCLKVLMP